MDNLITVNNVSKKFTKYIRRSMLYGANDIIRSFVGYPSKTNTLRKSEFWALDNVGFKLDRGESLALVGSNGSGKSSLLKLLNGIYLPDKGKISVQGKVAALIEVGAGFHPMLTGRENIYINGQILGMSIRQIKQKIDEIIEFSEIGDFLDTPVKNYSSGMYVRLGFSIAIHADSDILLVDEVLAVGDLGFATKCMKKIAKFRENGGSLILVSHAMNNVIFHTDKALWLEKGAIIDYDSSRTIVSKFEKFILKDSRFAGESLNYDEQIIISKFDYNTVVNLGDCLVFKISINFKRKVVDPIFMIHLKSVQDKTQIFSHCSNLDSYHWESISGQFLLTIKTKPISFKNGLYKISFSIAEGDINNHLTKHHDMYELNVINHKQIFGHYDIDPNYEIKKF